MLSKALQSRNHHIAQLTCSKVEKDVDDEAEEEDDRKSSEGQDRIQGPRRVDLRHDLVDHRVVGKPSEEKVTGFDAR